MSLSREKIDELIDAVDIVDLVSGYVDLKKTGKGYFGLCPFHDEKTPSFSVSVDKKIAKCMGCNGGGNPISFIMQIENMSFPQAVAFLAKKYNVDLGEFKYNNPNDQYSHLYRINDTATRMYMHVLKNYKGNKNAVKYLKERGITSEIVEKFQIGLATDQNDTLYKVLNKDGQNLDDAMELGLIRQDNGKHYDVFKNRVMFPIIDVRGKVLGFSGRMYLPTEGHIGKYVNSQESAIFKKSYIVYNLNNAASEIRKKGTAILFEGFMDVIAAYKADIKNGIATMGTAFTQEHAKIINNYTDKLIICFDGDNAGIKATKKVIDIVQNYNIMTYVAVIPEKLDPDDFLNKYGPDKLREQLDEKTISVDEFMYRFARHKKDFKKDSNQLLKFRDELFDYFAKKDFIIAERYLKEFSKDTGTSYDIVMKSFEEFRSNFKNNNKNNTANNKNNTTNNYTTNNYSSNNYNKSQNKTPKTVNSNYTYNDPIPPTNEIISTNIPNNIDNNPNNNIGNNIVNVYNQDQSRLRSTNLKIKTLKSKIEKAEKVLVKYIVSDRTKMKYIEEKLDETACSEEFYDFRTELRYNYFHEYKTFNKEKFFAMIEGKDYLKNYFEEANNTINTELSDDEMKDCIKIVKTMETLRVIEKYRDEYISQSSDIVRVHIYQKIVNEFKKIR